jgi:acyl-CoA synthetase (AMP-forming)/AMP-acid ligase II
MGGTTTVSDQLRLMAAELGDEVAIVDVSRDDRLTFTDWERRSNRVARGLTTTAGVGRGDRVAIHLPPTEPLDWVVAYAAVHKAGAVAVPLDTRLAPGEVRRLLDHAEPAAVLTSAEDVAAIEADDDGDYQVAVGPDDLADILYTSGTTGTPKGVAVAHANMCMLRAGLPTWSGRGWLTSSPLFTFAGITPIYSAMRLGLSMLHQPRFDVPEWLAVVERERPVMVFLVPAMVQLLVSDPGFDDADLSSLALVSVGSSPLAPGLLQRLRARVPRTDVTNSYSLTEAGSAYFSLPAAEARSRLGSIGRPVPPTEVKLLDEAGGPVPAGEVGELWLRVPGRMRHYYRDEAATAATWQGGWLRSGDLARSDDDGFLTIVGRAKDVIIRGGNNVHALDVELVLVEHPAVLEAAVAGVPHPVLGEDVAAWVVLRPGATATADELRAHCAARLADHKTPRHVTFIGELPRNATGKVVKSQLSLPEPDGRDC